MKTHKHFECYRMFYAYPGNTCYADSLLLQNVRSCNSRFYKHQLGVIYLKL